MKSPEEEWVEEKLLRKTERSLDGLSEEIEFSYAEVLERPRVGTLRRAVDLSSRFRILHGRAPTIKELGALQLEGNLVLHGQALQQRDRKVVT